MVAPVVVRNGNPCLRAGTGRPPFMLPSETLSQAQPDTTAIARPVFSGPGERWFARCGYM
jgi:hypothetical protein